MTMHFMRGVPPWRCSRPRPCDDGRGARRRDGRRQGQGRGRDRTAGKWDGPTTGPMATAGKTIIYLAGDMRNGGTEGVSRGVEEAAKAAGWTLRILDGRGDISARTAALNQAIALKPDGIIVGGFDALEQNAALQGLKEAGIPYVGWHATVNPGPDPKTGMFANVNTRIADVAQTAADLAIVDSGGKAGVVIFGDSNYEMAIGKARMMEADIKKCRGLHGAVAGRLADDRSLDPHAAAHDLAAAALRRQVDLLARRERPLLRLHGVLALRGRQVGDRHPAQHLGRRRFGIGLPAHPGQAEPDGHRAGAAARSRAGSWSTNSTAPSTSSPGPATCRASTS